MVHKSVFLLLLIAVCIDFTPAFSGDPHEDFKLWSQNFGFNFGNRFWPGIGPELPRDVEDLDEAESVTKIDRDREPLSPDYKDPKKEEFPEKNPDRPSRPEFSVIDVPAGGAGGSGFSGFPLFNSFPNSFFNIFGPVRGAKPWWKGPNVCTEKEEIMEDVEAEKDNKDDDDDDDDYDEPNFFSNINLSTCQQTPTKYECTTKIGSRGVTKTFVVKYKCCHGFRRKSGEPGCTKIDMKDVLETIQDLGGNEFVKLIKSTGLEEKISTQNHTIFVPTDEALADFAEKMLELNQIELLVPPARRRRATDIRNAVSSKELAMSHIVNGLVEMSEMRDDEVLHSENKNSSIRISMFRIPLSDEMVTANCIPLLKKDKLANNGVVQVIGGVMTPVRQSILDIIEESPKFSILKSILENSNMRSLFDSDKHFTFFAPSNTAFEKLGPDVREKLQRGNTCSKNIIRHHILTHSICSGAITMNATTRNIEDNMLFLRRDDDGNLLVDNTAKVIEPDVIATNGIIHVIDNILLPDSGLDTNEIMRKENLTKFHELINEAGLSEMINSLTNATLFIPTDEAIENAVDEIEKMKDNKQKLKEFVMYHVVDGQRKSCDFNDEMLKTAVEDKKLRVNLYSTLPLFKNVFNRATINCARLINFDEQACGTVLHQVNKVLTPPKDTLLEMIYKNDDYSSLKKLLNGTELEKELQSPGKEYTILAPTNDALDTLSEEQLNTLLKDKVKADEILRRHVIPDVLCCSGIRPQSFPFNEHVKTLSRYSVQPGYDMQHRMKFEDAVVTQCDRVATNGIIHSVNKVIFPPSHRNYPLGDLSFLLFDL